MITFQQDKSAPAELQAATASLVPMPEFNALKLTSIFLSQAVPVWKLLDITTDTYNVSRIPAFWASLNHFLCIYQR